MTEPSRRASAAGVQEVDVAQGERQRERRAEGAGDVGEGELVGLERQRRRIVPPSAAIEKGLAILVRDAVAAAVAALRTDALDAASE